MSLADRHLAPLRALVSQRFGLAAPERFDRHLLRGLDQAGVVLGLSARDQILLALAAQPWTAPAWQAVIDHVTVRETSFFRQRSWWHSVIEEALKPLIAARRRDGTRHLRCLSLGCASGEEPYSLAMVIEDLLAGEAGWRVEIVGADLCERALAEARRGVFDARAIREVSAAQRALWFRAAGHHRNSLDERLRAKVAFRLFNLAEAAEAAAAGQTLPVPGGPADLVICRNVIIHMEQARQPRIAGFLAGLVREGGRLVVSPVEATAAWFAPLRFQVADHAILFVKAGPKADGAPAKRARMESPGKVESPWTHGDATQSPWTHARTQDGKAQDPGAEVSAGQGLPQAGGRASSPAGADGMPAAAPPMPGARAEAAPAQIASVTSTRVTSTPAISARGHARPGGLEPSAPRAGAAPSHGASRPPEKSATRLDRARHLADLGLFEEARRLCEEALAASPEADLLMALVCQALGDLVSAEAAARRGLQANPAAPAAHYVLAIVCLRAGKTDAARRALADAVRLISAADDGTPLDLHLKIDAGQIRQAARRLGVGLPARRTMGGGRAGLH